MLPIGSVTPGTCGDWDECPIGIGTALDLTLAASYHASHLPYFECQKFLGSSSSKDGKAPRRLTTSETQDNHPPNLTELGLDNDVRTHKSFPE